MRKVFCLLLSLWIVPIFALENLPDKFFFKPEGFKEISAYLLECQGQDPFGRVKIAKDEKNTLFYFKINTSDKIQAIGRVTCPTKTFTAIQVTDGDGTLVGFIQHRRYCLSPPHYEIYDEEENLIGNADMNWVGSRFKITKPSNQRKEIATFRRPYFRISAMGDHWYLKMQTQDVIDPRLLVIIGAFQSDLERKSSPIR